MQSTGPGGPVANNPNFKMMPQGAVAPVAHHAGGRPMTASAPPQRMVQLGQISQAQPSSQAPAPSQVARPVEAPSEVVTSKKLQELVQQIDSRDKLDEEVEEMLIQIADDFIESVTSFSADLAKHRKSDTLEARDVALHLERNWNIKVPGYASAEDLKPYKKPTVPEAHKQRIALIKKTQNARAAGGAKK